VGALVHVDVPVLGVVVSRLGEPARGCDRSGPAGVYTASGFLTDEYWPQPVEGDAVCLASYTPNVNLAIEPIGSSAPVPVTNTCTDPFSRTTVVTVVCPA
jgi:hypothetical protein